MDQEIYIITFKDTDEIVNKNNLKKYLSQELFDKWKYWKPRKTIYLSIGMAKRGFQCVPDELKPYLAISIFKKDKELINGNDFIVQREVIKLEELDKQKIKDIRDKKKLIAEYKRKSEELEKSLEINEH